MKDIIVSNAAKKSINRRTKNIYIWQVNSRLSEKSVIGLLKVEARVHRLKTE